MKAVFRHELNIYFNSMRAYVFGAFLLLFTGFGALLYNINQYSANFEYVLDFISVVFIILIPMLTMRVFAEERKQKTDQLLYSLPITSGDIVVGKFLALAVVFAIPMILVCTYPFIFSRFGEVYLPTSYGAMFAFILLGLALISIGMFISCLTDSQAVSAGVCVAVMLLIYFSESFANLLSSSIGGSVIGLIVLMILFALVIKLLTKSDYVAIGVFVVMLIAVVTVYLVKPELLNGLLPAIMSKLSLYSQFQTFVNGVFDLTAIIYYLSAIVLFLFLCVQAFEKRRYNG